jgi:hypothetical protein
MRRSAGSAPIPAAAARIADLPGSAILPLKLALLRSTFEAAGVAGLLDRTRRSLDLKRRLKPQTNPTWSPAKMKSVSFETTLTLRLG